MEVGPEDLERIIGKRPVTRVLLQFNWDRHLGTESYYNDSPFLSETAAQWLVDHGCRLLGMDTAMPDNPKNGRGCSNDSPNHKILLGNNVILLEYMVNLAALNQPVVQLIVAPLKILGGDGSPVRAFAILD